MNLSRLSLRAIVGTLVYLAAHLSIGCRSSSNVAVREADQIRTGIDLQEQTQVRHQRERRPVAWQVLDARGKTVVLGKVIGYCYGGPKPRVAQVKLDESAEAIVLRMFIENPPRQRKGGACLGSEISLGKVVRLNHDIDDRPIYDGITSPPSRRLFKPNRGG